MHIEVSRTAHMIVEKTDMHTNIQIYDTNLVHNTAKNEK